MSASATRLLLAMLLALPCLASCGFTGGPVSGRVVDSETGKPIAGAIVVVRWLGTLSGPAHSQSVCIHVETAISEADGTYAVPRWFQEPRFLLSGGAPAVDPYRVGYEPSPHKLNPPADPSDTYMKVFRGDAKQRLAYLTRDVFSGMACLSGRPSERHMYPLFRAAYLEARAISDPAQWARIRDGLREMAAAAWLASPGDTNAAGDFFARLPDSIQRELP